MAAHARLSPSAADRWMTCTGSVRLIERLQSKGVIPADETSSYAAEGTVAHEVREMCLMLNLDPVDFIGNTYTADGFSFVVDEDMATHLQPGIDWIRERTDNPLLETRIDLSRWLPGQFGTLDCGFLMKSGGKHILVVNDLKYGQGVDVPAEKNRQLRIYALGLWDHFGNPNVDEVLIVIDQPRKGGLKTWTCPLDELYEFGNEVREVGIRILKGDDTLTVSEDGCRWCPVRTSEKGCPAYNDWMFELLGDDFMDLDAEPDLPEPEGISPERRWHIVRHEKMILDWLGHLKGASLAAALSGTPDPGSKLVAGRAGDRKFLDREAAREILVSALGDDAYKPRDIISPTQAEKLLKPGKRKQGDPATWDALTSLIARDEGKPVLASADDPRREYEPVGSLDELDDL